MFIINDNIREYIPIFKFVKIIRDIVLTMKLMIDAFKFILLLPIASILNVRGDWIYCSKNTGAKYLKYIVPFVVLYINFKIVGE